MTLNDESSRIPFEAGDLPGRRWLVLAPHPDDEVLGPGGALAAAGRRGVILRVVVITDGSAGGVGENLPARREEESRRAAAVLGIPEPRFLRRRDRSLIADSKELAEDLSRELIDFRPDLILAPSPVELHPDHRAIALTLINLVGGGRLGEPLFEAIRHSHLVFYEVATPMTAPNRIVDVTSTVELKREAAREFASQSAHDYGSVAGAFAEFRRLTLPLSVKAAEAFWVIAVPEVAKVGPAGLLQAIGGPAPWAPAEVTPISAVVRTRNRPELLGEALASLAAGRVLPREVVVVNDGGTPVESVLARFEQTLAIVPVTLASSQGRVYAANAGAQRVTSSHFFFLDDDDIVMPDHVETLGRALFEGPEPVVYSDAVTAIYRRSQSGEPWRCERRVLEYSRDFDANLLRFFNYIPIHTAAIPVDSWRSLGGFNGELDLSEDWDFLIRLAGLVRFRHVRRVTCEYRVFEGAGAPAHQAPGSEGFRAARRQIYERHLRPFDGEVIGEMVDRLRKDAEGQIARNWELDGENRREKERADEYQGQVERARGEFERLGGKLGALQREEGALRNEIAERDQRIGARDQKIQALEEGIRQQEQTLEALRREVGELTSLLAASGETENTLRARIEEQSRHLEATYAEISRLGSILKQIQSSRTWKLHLLIEKLRTFGRGN